MRSTPPDARSSSAPGTAPALHSLRALTLVLALALVANGCGGGSSTKTAAPVAARRYSAPRPAVAAAPRLSILSPRTGARTSSTLTVRVALHGAPGAGARFRYVLDHRLTRLGSARLTFHGLAPGRHRLEVFLATNSASRAATAFAVRAPAPIPVPSPAPSAPTTASVPSAPPPTSTAAPSPPPPTSTAAPPPPTTTAPPPSKGIPQGGGGDGDGDNSGAPSDGDGNI